MRIVAAIVLACLGCSSHYTPRARGRVAVTMLDGKVVYVRDGRIYPHGMVGSGLEQAVVGNAAAQLAAREYHDRLRDGLWCILGGAAAMLGGTTYAAYEAVRTPSSTRVDMVPIGVAVVGLAVMLYGAGRAASAEPYRWDAINLFNDAAELPPVAARVRTSPLRMRD
jgi:hypothetical protein